MKKNIVYIAIILMVLAGTMLTLTGCGDSKETKETINNLTFKNYSVKDGNKQVLERLKQARIEIYKK